MRKQNLEAVRTIMEMNVKGKKGKGRLKEKWLHMIECDMRTAAGVCMDDMGDCFKWRFRTNVADPK